jgi:hypothetical protein
LDLKEARLSLVWAILLSKLRSLIGLHFGNGCIAGKWRTGSMGNQMMCGNNRTGGRDSLIWNYEGMWQLCYLNGGSDSASGQGNALFLCSPFRSKHLASCNLLLLVGVILMAHHLG